MESTKPAKEKLSFIIYDSQNEGSHSPPRYFQMKKGMVKFLLYGFPIITTLSLLSVIAGVIYFKQIRQMVEKKEPKIIQKLKATNSDLSFALTEQTKLTKILEDRLANPKIEGLGTLSFFRPIPGQEDKSKTPVFSIDEIRYQSDSKKISVSFNISNNAIDQQKLAGYVFILLKIAGKISYYPKNAIPSSEFHLSYNLGESFAIRRSRPVKAEFSYQGNLKMLQDRPLLKILIFSRTGNLLYKQSKELTF